VYGFATDIWKNSIFSTIEEACPKPMLNFSGISVTIIIMEKELIMHVPMMS